jgi:hypothetical protein
MVCALSQRRSSAGRRFQTELIWHRVFLKHVRKPLYFTCRYRKECDAMTGRNQIS